jgi:hypothetical protein
MKKELKDNMLDIFLDPIVETKEVDPLIQELTISLQRSQLAFAKLKKSRDDFTQAVVNAAHDAMLALGPIPSVIPPKKDMRKKKEETAVLHSTDWQLGKKTLTYNTKECERLLHQSMDKTIQIAEIYRADHPVKDICIMFGGDIIENTTIFPSQVYEVDSDVMSQFVEASRIMIDLVRKALANFERVQVVCEPGNHGRIGKFGELPKDINWDKLVYMFVAQVLKDEKRLNWQMSKEDIQRVEIGNYKALLIHGDEIRWGTASTIVRFADRWRSGAYKFFDEVDKITKGFEFRDLYIGHYHQHQSWNMANGEGSVFMSGAVETGNRYARDLLASNGAASQRLHFVDPKLGRVTSEHRLWLL